YSYLPFGETTTVSAALANPFTFVGAFGVMREPGGLSYMRARYYATGTGQFVSDDPIGLAGGDVNQRRYVENNPTLLVDSLGTRGIYAQPAGDGEGGGLGSPAPFVNKQDPRGLLDFIFESNPGSGKTTTIDPRTGAITEEYKDVATKINPKLKEGG